MSWFTPPQIAEQLGVNVDRVRGWIYAGELEAVNVADSPKRPRWRISQDAYDEFLTSRTAVQKRATPKRRSKTAIAVKDYF